MSKFKLATRNTISGFAYTAVAALTSLLVVRACLLGMDKATYGVCMAATQMLVLLNFLDLGMGSSLARFLVDFKRDLPADKVAGVIKTASLLGVAQAVLCAAIMIGGGGPAADFMGISAGNRSLFVTMILWAVAPTALCFLTRPMGQVLYANGLLYVTCLIGIVASLLQTAAVLAALHHQWGPYSIVAGQWISFLCTQGLLLAYLWRSGDIPSLSVPAAPLSSLRPLFAFSQGVFFIAMGKQFLQFAPTMLITRLFGEARMGDWYAGTRVLALMSQVAGRIPSSSEPLFWHLYAAGDLGLVRRRLLETVRVTSSVSAFLGAMLVMANTLFVRIWTSGKVSWSPSMDALCCLWVFLTGISLSGGMVPGITKRLGLAKGMYVVEAACLIAISCVPGLKAQGFLPAVGCLIATHLAFSFTYHTLRIRRDLKCPWSEIVNAYGLSIAVFLLVALVSFGVARWIADMDLARAAMVVAGVQILVVTPVIWFGLVPEAIRSRVRQRIGERW